MSKSEHFWEWLDMWLCVGKEVKNCSTRNALSAQDPPLSSHDALLAENSTSKTAWRTPSLLPAPPIPQTWKGQGKSRVRPERKGSWGIEHLSLLLHCQTFVNNTDLSAQSVSSTKIRKVKLRSLAALLERGTGGLWNYPCSSSSFPEPYT